MGKHDLGGPSNWGFILKVCLFGLVYAILFLSVTVFADFLFHQ